jgi:hypothetical protein
MNKIERSETENSILQRKKKTENPLKMEIKTIKKNNLQILVFLR